MTDEGPGIPEAERERVFGRFVRGSGTGGAEGLGLGLALVREVVTWHRGHVSVRSADGTGCVFEVVLPLSGSSPARRSRTLATILVVDDDTAIRETAALALEKAGHAVRRAASVAEAMAQVRARQSTSSSPTSTCRERTASRSSRACARDRARRRSS
ncbi:MAG: hypothetical protein IPF66_16430 [Holophagales bacterium]|nr:hypothetical protein [Holophagales bacterium]